MKSVISFREIPVFLCETRFISVSESEFPCGYLLTLHVKCCLDTWDNTNGTRKLIIDLDFSLVNQSALYVLF